MYLLHTKSKRHSKVQLIESHAEAWRLAQEFVGQHNTVDGCSTPVSIVRAPGRFTAWRSTSFGERRATVHSQVTNEPHITFVLE